MRHLTSSSRGFSLLELALTMGVVGGVVTGLWQLMGMSGQVRDAATIASQAQAVAAAGQQYINSQRSSLLALGGLAALNSVVRIKILASDTGDTTTSVAGLGYLPPSFNNVNGYGQSYRLYVRREDGGTIGVADEGDTLVGLLISTGGSAMSDTLGARLSGFLGAAGGFMYDEDNPADPTAATDIRGTGAGWAIDLSAAGWSGIGAAATAGRVAVLTNLVPQAAAGAGNATTAPTGASAIDDLSDGATNYSSTYTVFIGDGAGAANTTGAYNTALGIGALAQNSTGSSNTAFGYRAAYDVVGSGNTAIGYNALNTFVNGAQATGNYNTAIGSATFINLTTESQNTAIGYNAGYISTGSDITAIGANALYGGSGGSTLGTGSTVIGANAWTQGEYNAVVGGNTGSHHGGGQGDYNAVLGQRAMYYALGAVGNVALGYQAGDNGSSDFTGDYNIAIGNAAAIPDVSQNYQLNIGNYIYGRLDLAQMNIGSSTLVSGISFDVGTKTSSARVAKGTTAQRPFCSSALRGAQRWNTDHKSIEYCMDFDDDGDGENDWYQMHVYGAGAGDPNIAGTGYVVITKNRWDGNLGGFSGADAKCLSDLTTYDWKGKATAIANGKLVGANVKAILFTAGWACNDWNISMVPGASYAFAVADRPLMGGAVFTTDAAGNYPGNLMDWTAANYLDGQTGYWVRTLQCSAATACNTWTSNSSSDIGGVGTPGSSVVYKELRFSWAGSWDGRTGAYEDSCDTQYHLLCLVGP